MSHICELSLCKTGHEERLVSEYYTPHRIYGMFGQIIAGARIAAHNDEEKVVSINSPTSPCYSTVSQMFILKC